MGTKPEKMEFDEDGNGIADSTFIPSKSQMHTPLGAAVDTVHIRSAAILEGNVTPSKQRKEDGLAAAANTNRQM